MIGSLVGDAAGIPIKFNIKKDITKDMIEKALNIEGGGIAKSKPG